MFTYDEKTKTMSLVGLRTYVLTGAAALDQHDVADADVIEDDGEDGEVPYVSVDLKLDKAGARKLRLLTTEWSFRRLAILSNGKIQGVPLVNAHIERDAIQIPIGPHSDANVASAKKLVEEIRHK